ncbi:hypothetical protein SUGI_0482740 [Cryptomeria japonica]|uniref:uncharacterized protein LOC131064407 n=1 Tax=Cryptomeria japonica TaxID=3369 RepID=UPI002408DF14|nr:uncharacterized protein LOC131064407 [Cryptomeria japonica]GLJ25230.1 hypothetical protein SUGI_0482740 [Cryptomeria japonica]
MQMVWKKNKKRSRPLLPRPSNLPFEDENDTLLQSPQPPHDSDQNLALSKQFQALGDALAENGKYDEALGKWEAALSITPERAVLHEQKAQILLEIGETWKALQAATRATELQPSWPEAWVTLSRAQLNFGEPELSIQSSKKALELQPNCKDAQVDMEVAMHLIANKRQLRQAGVRVAEYRYTVGDSEKRPSNSNDDSENASSKSVEILSPESAEKTLYVANVDSLKNADES